MLVSKSIQVNVSGKVIYYIRDMDFRATTSNFEYDGY